MSVFSERDAPRTAVQFMSLSQKIKEGQEDLFHYKPLGELIHPVVFLDRNTKRPLDGFYECEDLVKFHERKPQVICPLTNAVVEDPGLIDSVSWTDAPKTVDYEATDSQLIPLREKCSPSHDVRAGSGPSPMQRAASVPRNLGGYDGQWMGAGMPSNVGALYAPALQPAALQYQLMYIPHLRAYCRVAVQPGRAAMPAMAPAMQTRLAVPSPPVGQQRAAGTFAPPPPRAGSAPPAQAPRGASPGRWVLPPQQWDAREMQFAIAASLAGAQRAQVRALMDEDAQLQLAMQASLAEQQRQAALRGGQEAALRRELAAEAALRRQQLGVAMAVSQAPAAHAAYPAMQTRYDARADQHIRPAGGPAVAACDLFS